MTVPTASPITVVLVDDHDLFREGLHSLMVREAGIKVVGQAADAGGACRIVADLMPDIVVLDVELGVDHVSSTLPRLLRASPRSRIVIVTMHRDGALRNHLLRLGASGYVTKDLPSARLLATIREVHAHGGGRERPASERTHLSALTDRERAVMVLIAAARSNAAIAAELSIAVGTVKRHTNTIFRKLGATSRVDAVRRYRLVAELDDSGVDAADIVIDSGAAE